MYIYDIKLFEIDKFCYMNEGENSKNKLKINFTEERYIIMEIKTKILENLSKDCHC